MGAQIRKFTPRFPKIGYFYLTFSILEETFSNKKTIFKQGKTYVGVVSYDKILGVYFLLGHRVDLNGSRRYPHYRNNILSIVCIFVNFNNF